MKVKVKAAKNETEAQAQARAARVLQEAEDSISELDPLAEYLREDVDEALETDATIDDGSLKAFLDKRRARYGKVLAHANRQADQQSPELAESFGRQAAKVQEAARRRDQRAAEE
jgi:hypothetical protein